MARENGHTTIEEMATPKIEELVAVIQMGERSSSLGGEARVEALTTSMDEEVLLAGEAHL